MAMPDPLAEASLDALGRVDEMSRGPLLHDLSKRLLAQPAAAAALVSATAASSAEDRADAAAVLLSAILDEARMARENGAPGAAETLAAVEAALRALDEDGALSPPLRMRFAQVYAGAGLEPPTATILTPEAIEAAGLSETAAGAEGAPDVGALLDGVVKSADGDPLQAHGALGELFAALPMEMRAFLVTMIAMREGAIESRLALYWLLDRASEIRLAAATGLASRASAGGLDADTAALLPTLRKWLPERDARDALDTAIRAVMRRGGASTAPTPWTVHRTLASLPDGAGAQSLAAAVQRGSRRGVFMLLPKQGHGLRDAFIVPCRSATEQKKLLSQATTGIESFEVAPDYAPAALARAIGEGLALGLVPAPGVVDAAEVWGEEALSPVEADARAILSQIGADAALADLSVRARGGLVLDSEHWPEAFASLDSWFEDTAEVREICARYRADRTRESALWKYLETRREWWARQIAVAAATLKARPGVEPRLWASFAATAQALLDGRPLKKTPIMREIVLTTLDAAEAASSDAPALDELEPAGLPPVEFVAPPPEAPGELARLLARGGMTEPWLEGYLAAQAISPRLARPSDWLGSLLGAVDFENEGDVQRALDLVMLRMNRINDETADPDAVAGRLASYDEAALRDWARGFSSLVAAAKAAWPPRTLGPDDKRMLARLAGAERGAAVDDLRSVLPAWVARRRAARS